MIRIKAGGVKRHSGQAVQNRRSVKFLTPHFSLLTPLFPLLTSILILWGCTFDYGTSEAEDSGQPDIIMNDVEYVRVRDGDPVVRFQAQRAERYEKRQTMELRDFSFEQFGNHGEDINAAGRAGTASVELDSGNIHLGGGVSIAVDSEDITIETGRLDWQDKERILSGEAGGAVNILRENGTSFTGRGFTANVRSRTWGFSDGVDGTYIHDDEEEEDSGGELDEAAEAAEGEMPAGEDGTTAVTAGEEPGL
ncbi:MAG: LPS export ABC transporter periplasmic protein LptC [Treponema sp.]|nr:LPS export ABC transporter periplasmic protein LptC [Treponema sp.]